MNIGQQFLRALLQSWVERCDRDLLPKSKVWKGVPQQPGFSYTDCDPETSVLLKNPAQGCPGASQRSAPTSSAAHTPTSSA